MQTSMDNGSVVHALSILGGDVYVRARDERQARNLFFQGITDETGDGLGITGFFINGAFHPAEEWPYRRLPKRA